MQARYTSELANDFGNLASRLIAMIEKYCGGVIPEVSKEPEFEKALAQTVAVADKAFCALDFQGGIVSIMEFCKLVNGYVTTKEPWAIAKDPDRVSELNSVLYNTADAIRALAVLLHPVMPETSEKLWDSLGANTLGPIEKQLIHQVSTWGQLEPGTKVTKGEILFPRLEEVAK